MVTDYFTEYEDAEGQIRQKDYVEDIHAARNKARYLTRRNQDLLVYVVACDAEGRVGAECYAKGRRDHVEGRMS